MAEGAGCVLMRSMLRWRAPARAGGATAHGSRLRAIAASCCRSTRAGSPPPCPAASAGWAGPRWDGGRVTYQASPSTGCLGGARRCCPRPPPPSAPPAASPAAPRPRATPPRAPPAALARRPWCRRRTAAGRPRRGPRRSTPSSRRSCSGRTGGRAGAVARRLVAARGARPRLRRRPCMRRGVVNGVCHAHRRASSAGRRARARLVSSACSSRQLAGRCPRALPASRAPRASRRARHAPSLPGTQSTRATAAPCCVASRRRTRQAPRARNRFVGRVASGHPAHPTRGQAPPCH